MGYLLKEVLKTLCGINQWSYAVYWKIGCQNPKLLIWEECYYEPASCSGLLIGKGNPQTYSNLESCIQSVDKVHFLIHKMMEDNHVNIVGQGLVGRVALTGNHQWILSDNYFKESSPPEVLKEVFQQFSAGMKTVAVIPVLPHGVVQFGSYKTIMENMGFVEDVKSLICQLSENCTEKELDHTPGDFSLESNLFNDSSLFDGLNYFGNSFHASLFESRTSYSSTTGIQNDPVPNISTIQASNSNTTYFKPHDYCQKAQINSAEKLNFSPLMNGVAKAEVISSSAEIWMKNQHASQYIPASNQDLSSRSSGGQIHFSNSNVSTGILISAALTTNSGLAYDSTEDFVTSRLCQDVIPDLKGESVENITSTNRNEGKNASFCQIDKKQKFSAQIHSPNISRFDDAFLQPQSGDDLFDILGADYKSNLLNSSLRNELATNAHNWDKSNFPSKASSEVYTSNGTDHLLDAVVSKVNPLTKQSLDDNVSCKTTMTDVSSSFSAVTSLPYGRFGIFDQLKGELLGIPKYQAKAGAMATCSFRTGSSKEETVTNSHGSSIYGSQESSWIGKGQIAKQNNSVSTGNSKKQGDMVKTNCKRLKPGENPRPRPKDRQMIQDRVKELREIVPNGAKCSIDALFERTIKHMLFLQSVTKHADKLKQTGESKIFSKDGGLVLKDNFDGGATWAYEVGSQSMVCPIIVEDLNQPRQMLVEMLCEERGLFLEIADIIRGMGLTILKGVMETRNDKIWARFAVEANRDVTRMEIFLSLVRLLDETAKTCSSQPNGLSCENMMVQSQ